jgi:predicted RNA binding protein YcfA (HicA-like mRNA interferase family)
MKLPRNASGQQVIAALERSFGYRVVHREGSHIILQTNDPRRHRVTGPDHKTLRVGTLNSILRAVAAAQGLSKGDIAERLFG